MKKLLFSVFAIACVFIMLLPAYENVKAASDGIYPSSKTIKKFLKNLESTTEIPTVCIYTDNNAEVVSREEYVDCIVYTINCDKEYKLSAEAAGIRVRGNSTAYGGNKELIRKNQVPYRIKFKTKTNMFGLNDEAKCKNWVLLKAESRVLNNDIAFRLGRTILRDNYCSDGILVHAYLNGKYVGMYELCEQSQVNKHRINIFETPENYEGTDTGYLVEIDNYGEKPCFRVNYAGNPSVTDINGVKKTFNTAYYSVKSDVYSDAQVEYIKKYVNNIFKVVYEACENKKYYVLDENNDLVKATKKQKNKKDENGELIDPAEAVIGRVLNIDSVVDMYLLHEIVRSCDVGEGSFYMYADCSAYSEDKRLTFTCPWDFEWAYTGSLTDWHAAVFNTKSFADTYGERSNPWFIILMKQDWFVEKVKARWTELRTKSGKAKYDPISRCIKEEKKLVNTYRDDIKKDGSNAPVRAEGLISWVEKRIKTMDGWFLNG